MLGAIAQAEHRLDDAARSLSAAAAASERLGFLGQAALHLTTLGRVQHRAGDSAAALDTLDRAIAAANTSGDLRIAATARVHQARLLRAAGDHDTARTLLEQTDHWYRSSGGGEGALLTRCLLAALGQDCDALDAVLADARETGDREVQVLALDALARLAANRGDLATARRLLESADDLATGVQHVVDDLDRLDATTVRAQLAD
jgi:tetratricopeptide (TPR) repeat protein